MPHTTRTRGLVLAAVLALLALPGAATAQDAKFPSRAITLVVPFPPGGSTTIVARIVTDRMDSVETVSIGVWVDVGTRHEPAAISVQAVAPTENPLTWSRPKNVPIAMARSISSPRP